MTDGAQVGQSPFDGLDAKLTMFALANGVDLSRGEDYRRLEWFFDALERGILIRPEADGTFELTVMAWRSGHPEPRTEQIEAAGVRIEDISITLSDAIETVNALEAPD